MKTPFFLSAKTIGRSRYGGRKPSDLRDAAQHNLREGRFALAAHIDPSRSSENIILIGPKTAEAVVELVASQARACGIELAELRTDYCQAVELVFSLPPDTKIDLRAYFSACAAWVAEKFGAAEVLSVVVHLDEDAPHAHALISPLTEGRMVGSRLVTKARLSGLKKSFEILVARPFGLHAPPPRLQRNARLRAAQAVKQRMQDVDDPALRSAGWSAIEQAIDADPRPWLSAFQIDEELFVIRKPLKSMGNIFTSTGKGPKRPRAGDATETIRFSSSSPRQHQTYPV